MTSEKYRVRVTKDHLVFSAAHFITFNGTICERLHGHNWRAAVEVAGPLDENSYVFDFIALRDATQRLVNELDHHVLLPTQHPAIHVTSDDREVTATFESRRWVFPREDCVLLPVANTTAELIARWMAFQLKQTLATHAGAANLETLTIEIEENFGQWAICQIPMHA
ncbi:6-pyruvoyl trahydropterin synthase family protein [Schlesneria paludicola]|uniref:6-pyruvoyl trahydropterin synthase family protein n=1 Tax=Schlesneria paludicola TaxID=360056 RepID=UPI00029B031E|nr:6-pyruvoyl tetrahydropterin synthase family protein [Schlesneria paludicola]